jgi:hypothetical protein
MDPDGQATEGADGVVEPVDVDASVTALEAYLSRLCPLVLGAEEVDFARALTGHADVLEKFVVEGPMSLAIHHKQVSDVDEGGGSGVLSWWGRAVGGEPPPRPPLPFQGGSPQGRGGRGGGGGLKG